MSHNNTVPDIDHISHIDFFDQTILAGLSLPDNPAEREQALESLMAYQRIHRICNDEATTRTLLSQQFDSAHRITAMTRRRFIETAGPHINTSEDPDLAGRLYDRAKSITIHLQHTAASLHSVVASPHFKDTRFNNTDDPLKKYVTRIPGYQDLFGSQDFCQCKDCQSIFSPAAYFLDIMRITDDHITSPNKTTIDPGMTLEERRPDLFDLDLTCTNTNDQVPYLEIVNNILESHLSHERHHINDLMNTLAFAVYPFNLPYHLPLSQIRIYLQQLKTPLAELYTAFSMPLAYGTAQAATINTITLAADTPAGPHDYRDTMITIISGTGAGQQKTIRTYDPATKIAALSENWQTPPNDKSMYYITDSFAAAREQLSLSIEEADNLLPPSEITGPSVSRFYGYEDFDETRLKNTLAPADTFLYRTGLDYTRLVSLLTQELDEEEQKANAANDFFINNTGEELPYMKLMLDRTDPQKPFEKIENLSLRRLDRLNRFIRLQTKTGWSYADTDWALRSFQQTEIGRQTIKKFARLHELQQTTAMTIVELCSMWHPLKNSGKKNTANPQDPFDIIFNDPRLLKGRDPYAPTGNSDAYLPFDPEKNYDWLFPDNQGINAIVRSRLLAALRLNDNDLSLLAGWLHRHIANPQNGELLMLTLNLENLSWLYRLPKLAAKLKLSIADLLLLLELMHYPDTLVLQQTEGLEAARVQEITTTVGWMRRTGISPAQLQYILTGQTPDKFDRGYDPEKIPGFLQTLGTLAATARIDKTSFVFENIDAGMAEMIFTALKEDNFIDAGGIVLQDKTLDYSRCAALFPVSEKAFTGEKITPEHSKEIFLQLLKDKILERSFSSDGVEYALLNKDFTPFTPLNFTFILPPIPPLELVRAEVRNTLLQIRRDLDHTIDLLPSYTRLQENMAMEQLATFLGTTTQMLGLLLPFSAKVIGLKDYGWDLLSPLRQELLPAFKDNVCETSFEKTSLISDSESVKIFGLLVRNKIIIPDPPDPKKAAVSNTFKPWDSLDFLFEDGERDATAKKQWVKDILLTSSRAASIRRLIALLARGHMLVKTLGLKIEDIETIFNHPSCCHIDNLLGLTLEGILSISTFRQLATGLKDGGKALGHYFTMRETPQLSGEKIRTLATLTGWETDQLSRLIKSLWPPDGKTATRDNYNDVQGLTRLKKCFDLVARTGIDIYGLLNLYTLATLPLTDASNQPLPSNWALYVTASGAVLDAASAATGEESFPGIVTGFGKILNTQKRNVLLPFTIWRLQPAFAFIQTPRDLYQYLLIDVEMSACDSLSLISEGIAAIQLYMQRCRIMVEKGVTDLSGIPAAWWQWMMAYRIWEANRKIFLYPENYLDPFLRRDKTPPFKAFTEALQQANVSPDTIQQAFNSFFDAFALAAGLVYCDSFHWKEKDTTKDTLFFFGRTNISPYQFYYRKYSPPSGRWTPWELIDIAIPSPHISPVFAYNKLFIFWLEIGETSYPDTQDATTRKSQVAIRATIKYAFYNQNGQWQEQSATDHIVEDYFPLYSEEGSNYIPLNGIDPDALFWKKVYALHLPQKNYTGTIPITLPERILVNVGDAYPLPTTKLEHLPRTPQKSEKKENPDKYKFEVTLLETTERAKKIEENHIPSPGQIFLMNSRVIASNLLETSPQCILLDYNSIEGDPRPYRPDFLQSRLVLIRSDSVIYDNYFTEYLASADRNSKPAPTDAPLPLLYNTSIDSSRVITIKNQPGWFLFDNGDDVFLLIADDPGLQQIDAIVVEMNTPLSGIPNEIDLWCTAYTTSGPEFSKLKFKVSRLSTNTITPLSQKLFFGGIDALLTLPSQQTPELPFSRFYEPGKKTPPPSILITDPDSIDILDFNGAYGAYFWELFFHGPFMLASAFNINRQYEQAMKWYQYVFDPTESEKTGGAGEKDRFWRFRPFRNMNIPTLIRILSNPAQIEAYNDNPFDPDAIARLRPSAYAKTIAMKYIGNLLDWGDFLFSQDTRESITQATNLYVMASDLLGKKPEPVKDCPKPRRENFNGIKDAYNKKTVRRGTVETITNTSIKLDQGASDTTDAYTGMYLRIIPATNIEQQRYITAYDGPSRTAIVDRNIEIPVQPIAYDIFKDGIPQFFIRLENSSFAVSVSPASTGHAEGSSSSPFNNIPSYFCIPENGEWIAYWDRLEDRLYKIRHCMNIKGIERTLAPFAPPIDPRMLIQAAAAGGGFDSINVLEPQVPYYRFRVMIEKTRSLTGTLTQFGNALLAALEKKEAEALATLMGTQEKRLLDLTSFIKQQQIDDLKQQQAGLDESRRNAAERYTYYTDLINIGLTPDEQLSIEEMSRSQSFNVKAGITRAMSSIGYAIPNAGSPFAMTYGGQQIGAVLSASAAFLEMEAAVSTYHSQKSLTMAGYHRRQQEWELQQKMAGFDEAQIGYTLASNEIQQEIAQQDLNIHLETIRQNEERRLLQTDKFTNTELYQWMVSRLSTVYFQLFTLAHDLARSAQRAYQYEMNTAQAFISFGYWDNLRKGLLAGEGLALAIEQMDKTYTDNHIRTLEIRKNISLLQLDPKALLDLVNKGECIFNLSEKLFDQDFPGHFARKIKSVSVSIPAVTGPYQGIKATLTQLTNHVIMKADIDAVKFLLGDDDVTMPGTDVLRSNWWTNQQIALSAGINDSGLFELNFNDDRYLPFEGTGAVSSWKLSMPGSTNHLVFESITDVIIQLQYCSFDGGKRFREEVQNLDTLKEYTGSRFFILNQQFALQWHTFLHIHPNTETQELQFILKDLVPPHVKDAALTRFYFQLHVPEDTNTTGKYDYITLKLTDDIADDILFNLDDDHSFTHEIEPGLSIGKVEGNRSLLFDIGKAPDDLKKGDPEYLDPDKILSAVLVLFYSSII
ncbi:MAG TPA: neuraminidase-like domain-containing protein [Puia sp.]|jgi:hypothetical protein